MTYVHGMKRERETMSRDDGGASAHPGVSVLTYLVFALSVGFAAALVLGVLA